MYMYVHMWVGKCGYVCRVQSAGVSLDMHTAIASIVYLIMMMTVAIESGSTAMIILG